MSKAPQTQSTKTAQCLCKKLEISVTGVDKGSVLCHCENCKRYHGSTFAHNHRFTRAEVKVVKGEDLLKHFSDSDTKSGNTLDRHFCANCGTPMFLRSSGFKGLVIMHSPAFELSERQQPAIEFFPENKYAWVGASLSKSQL